MALNDVTAEGVERAIAEFENMGRDSFLARFGFGRSQGYFLVRADNRYDSKAIVGVAHGYDRPDLGPLLAQDFSGGDRTVASLLESLGFDVERPPRNPPWVAEELVLALDLYLRRGLVQKEDPDLIQLSSNLNSLSIHSNRPDVARFRNPNGVYLKLANFAAIDPNDSRRGMSHTSKLDTEVWNRYASDEDALAAAVAAVGQGDRLPDLPTDSSSGRTVSETEIEARNVDRFQVLVDGRVIEAMRREQVLVHAYAEHLKAQGHLVTRRTYKSGESAQPLACDLMDKTQNVLYEAKGDVRRASIRMAIGQLLDYRRFEDESIDLAVLLPRQPSRDLVSLILSVPAIAVWCSRDGFETVARQR